jgi:hypothetical protein
MLCKHRSLFTQSLFKGPYQQIRRPKRPNLNKKVKGKDKVHTITDQEDAENEQRYSFTLSLTSALDAGGLSTSLSARFSPGKESRYQLYRRLDGPQGRSGQIRKISALPGFDQRTLQPVASRYTDWAIPAHVERTTGLKSKLNIIGNP